MEETPAGPGYELEVVWLHRPWWGLGLIGRWEELVAEPPPGTSFAEVQVWAEKFRAAGGRRGSCGWPERIGPAGPQHGCGREPPTTRPGLG